MKKYLSSVLLSVLFFVGFTTTALAASNVINITSVSSVDGTVTISGDVVSKTSLNPGADFVSIDWGNGDTSAGIVITITNPPKEGSWSAEYTYPAAGVYDITAYFEDVSAVENDVVVDQAPDNTAPVLDLPADITEEATGPDGANVEFSVSATDEDPANPEVSCDYNSGDLFPLGLTTVNCSATDTANNEATGSFTITVEDTTGPEITVPGTVNDSTTGTSTPVSYVVTANDLVDGNVSVNCTPASGSGFAVGTTTVNCSATDSENNSSEAFFDVIVVYTETPDTVAPVISGTPEGASATTTGTSTVVTYDEPTAEDNVVGVVDVTCVPPSGSLFPVGVTTVNCTATDGSNTATTTFDVVVTQVDPEPVYYLLSYLVNNISWGSIIGSSTQSILQGSNGSEVIASPALGYHFVNWAEDLATSTTRTELTVMGDLTFTANFAADPEVPDTTAPVISAHADVFATTTGTSTVVTYEDPTSEDEVDGTLAVNCNPDSGSLFAVGTTTVNCSASDTSDNTATSSFNVIITQVQGENNEEVVEEEEDNNSGGGSGGSNNSNNNSNDEEVDIVTVLALINAFGVSDASAPAEEATTPAPTEEVAGTEVGLTDESGATTTENTLPLAAAAATAEGSGFSWWWIVLLLVIAGIIWFLMRRRKNEGQ